MGPYTHGKPLPSPSVSLWGPRRPPRTAGLDDRGHHGGGRKFSVSSEIVNVKLQVSIIRFHKMLKIVVKTHFCV